MNHTDHANQAEVEKAYEEMLSLMTQTEGIAFLEKEANTYLGIKRSRSFLSQESLDSMSDGELEYVLRYIH